MTDAPPGATTAATLAGTAGDTPPTPTLHPITFWFDPISPYAYLAFERLPQALEGIAHVVTYRPVLFAGLLKHWGQLGPAEIAPKRAWTYRDVLWRARRDGIALRLPAAHPFNPLPLLRLALACAHDLDAGPGRHVVGRVFGHVWRAEATGAGATAAPQAADDPLRLQSLRAQLSPRRDPDGDDVRTALRAAGARAIAQGIFGVPTLVCRGRAYWGDDALPMLREALLHGDDAVLDAATWEHAAGVRGVQRR